MYWTVILHIMLELWSSIYVLLCRMLTVLNLYENFVLSFHIVYWVQNMMLMKINLYICSWIFIFSKLLIVWSSIPPNLEKAHPPTMNNIFMPKMHSVYSQWVWLSISIIRKPVMRDFWNWVICTVNQNRSFGDRAFSISAPRLWNALPQHLKDSTSCQAFKKCLKTHLFRLAHWGVVDYDSNYDNVQRFWTFYEWKRRYINSNYYYYT